MFMLCSCGESSRSVTRPSTPTTSTPSTTTKDGTSQASRRVQPLPEILATAMPTWTAILRASSSIATRRSGRPPLPKSPTDFESSRATVLPHPFYVKRLYPWRLAQAGRPHQSSPSLKDFVWTSHSLRKGAALGATPLACPWTKSAAGAVGRPAFVRSVRICTRTGTCWQQQDFEARSLSYTRDAADAA